LPLADATRNRRALGYVGAVFVLIDVHNELHSCQTITCLSIWQNRYSNVCRKLSL
jgi:hypothetical protein